jgi:phage-related minor tail protein
MALATFNGASAFAPQQNNYARPAVTSFMSDESSAEAGGKLVVIKEETVEFTAGVIGGVAGFVVGGPVLGAVGAAAANYVAKSEDEAGEIVGAVSKSALEVVNYLLTLDNKYEVLASAQSSLESALDKLKSQDKVDSAAIGKVESALASTKAKIEEVNDEYDLVGSGMTALGVVGDLVEKTVKKVGELNEEYELTDKAKTALSSAVDKAKEAAVKA